MKQLCAQVEPGGGRIEACLKQNAARLSPACTERVAVNESRMRSRAEEFVFACGADFGRLCGDVKPGGGRAIACLSRNQDRLSSTCGAAMEKIENAREAIATVRTACRADVTRLCSAESGEAGPLVECLQTHRASLSDTCQSVDFGVVMAAAQVSDAVDTMTSASRTQEALQIMQGIDTIAFSRSQILLQFDSYQAFEDRGSATRLLFNPQFVFGQRNQYALQLKAPVSAVFPRAAGAQPEVGLSDVTTAFGWAFLGSGHLHQYLSLALRWKTASSPTSSNWAVTPAYAIAVGITRWLAFTGQLAWTRSFAENGAPGASLLLVEPVFVFNLPARSFFVLDTRLGWNLLDGSFVPVMKGVVGMFVDRQQSVSISAWYQHSLSHAAVAQSFEWGVGTGLAYYFDW